MAAINSYVMHILVILAEQQAQPDGRESSWYTAREIMAAMEIRRDLVAHKRVVFSVPNQGDLVDVLHRLHELGILEQSFESTGEDGQLEDTWQFNTRIRRDRRPDGTLYLGGSFGGEPPPPPDAQPPDDDRTGRGFGEIISHPVLFCLGEEDFEAELDRALGLVEVETFSPTGS